MRSERWRRPVPSKRDAPLPNEPRQRNESSAAVASATLAGILTLCNPIFSQNEF